MSRRRAWAAALALALAASGCSEAPTDAGREASGEAVAGTDAGSGTAGEAVAGEATAGGDAGEGAAATNAGAAGAAAEPDVPAETAVAASGEDAPAPSAAPSVGAAPSPELRPERTTYDVEATFHPAERRLTGVTVVTARNEAEVATSEARLTAYLNAFHADAVRARNPVLPEHRKRAYPAGTAALDGRLEASSASVDGVPATVERRGATLVVALPEPWAPGEWRRIELAWDATLPEVHHRFGMEGDAYWFGNAMPILAVFDGEWRDYAYEPVGDPFYSAIADFRVRLTAPRDYAVVASGDETAAPEGAAGDGFATTTVDAPRARDFAFALGASHRVVGAETAGGARVNVYYRDASEARASAAAEAAAGMIDLLEGWVGAYPYREMDIFENEMFVTGMEYPGLAFVRGDRLGDPDGVETVVHEVAHQWFYNAVGNDQVREPWLDESFATYMTDVYLLGDRLDATYAERLRALRKGAAVGDARAYDSWSAYWTGNYRKGALLLHALRGELGEEGFERFLKAYYERFRDGIATEAAFVEAAASAHGAPLDAFFEQWLP